MSSARNYQHKYKKNNNTRHGDWICQFCQNYNYSFRVICNRYIIKAIDAQLNPFLKILIMNFFNPHPRFVQFKRSNTIQ